jgi:hypothetical protein
MQVCGPRVEVEASLTVGKYTMMLVDRCKWICRVKLIRASGCRNSRKVDDLSWVGPDIDVTLYILGTQLTVLRLSTMISFPHFNLKS